MQRTALTEELKLIEIIVAAHPSGIGIAGVEAEMDRRQGEKPNRRTLQRRLQKLAGLPGLTLSPYSPCHKLRLSPPPPAPSPNTCWSSPIRCRTSSRP